MKLWTQIIGALILSWVVSILIDTALKTALDIHLDSIVFLGLVVIIYIYIISNLWKDMIVKIDPLEGAVIKDVTSGSMRVVGPGGWHDKWFWPEEVMRVVSLKEIKLEIKEGQYETQDSPVMVSGLLIYRPDIRHLIPFVYREQAALEEILASLIKAAVGEILSDKKSDDAVKERPEMGVKIIEIFKQNVELYRQRNGRIQQEDILGIEVVNFLVSSIKIDPKLQEAKTREDIEQREKKSEQTDLESWLQRARTLQAAAKEAGNPVTFEEALSMTAMVGGRGVTRKELVFRGLSGDNKHQPQVEIKVDDRD